MTAVTGTVSSTTGSSGWTNPNNIFTSNNVYAVSASCSTNVTTGYIFALGNGFSIPTGATVDGLEISIEAKNGVAGAGFRVRNNSSDIFLRNGGADISPASPSGVSNASWFGTTDTTIVMGSATASWSASLTPTIVNDASFGVRLRAINLNASAQTFSIDRILITVYYTDSAGVQSSQQLFMYEG
jgi:hypothetical protein